MDKLFKIIAVLAAIIIAVFMLYFESQSRRKEKLPKIYSQILHPHEFGYSYYDYDYVIATPVHSKKLNKEIGTLYHWVNHDTLTDEVNYHTSFKKAMFVEIPKSEETERVEYYKRVFREEVIFDVLPRQRLIVGDYDIIFKGPK